MICKRGGFIIQSHYELLDLEPDLLDVVCNDVETEPVLQEITGVTSNSGAKLAYDARLDIHARGFWPGQKSAFFDIRVYHPNADSYKDQVNKNKCIAFMKTRRKECMSDESWKSNKRPLRH